MHKTFHKLECFIDLKKNFYCVNYFLEQHSLDDNDFINGSLGHFYLIWHVKFWLFTLLLPLSQNNP